MLTIPMRAATPDAPAPGKIRFYAKTDGKFYSRRFGGGEILVGPVAASGGLSPFVVGLSGAEAYSTIQSAITAAKAEYVATGRGQVVYVKPGTYTEAIAFVDGVSVVGLYAKNAPEAIAGYGIRPAIVVVGSHSVDYTGAADPVTFDVVGVLFKQASSAIAALDTSGVGLGLAASFVDCAFECMNGSTAASLIRVGASNSTAPNYVYFDRCQVRALGTSYAVRVTGNSAASFTNSSNVHNGSDSIYGVSLSGTGVTSSFPNVYGKGCTFSAFTFANSSKAYLYDCQIDSSGVAFNLTEAGTLAYVKGCSVNGIGTMVDGIGQFVMEGPASFADANPFGASVQIQALHIAAQSMYGTPFYADESVNNIDQTTTVVECYPGAVGGPVSVVLPNPNRCIGVKLYVVDADGLAGTDAITITSGGTVYGDAVIDTPYGAALCVAGQAGWSVSQFSRPRPKMAFYAWQANGVDTVFAGANIPAKALGVTSTGVLVGFTAPVDNRVVLSAAAAIRFLIQCSVSLLGTAGDEIAVSVYTAAGQIPLFRNRTVLGAGVGVQATAMVCGTVQVPNGTQLEVWLENLTSGNAVRIVDGQVTVSEI